MIPGGYFYWKITMNLLTSSRLWHIVDIETKNTRFSRMSNQANYPDTLIRVYEEKEIEWRLTEQRVGNYKAYLNGIPYLSKSEIGWVENTADYNWLMTLPEKLEQRRMYGAEEYFNQGSGIVTLCGSTRFFFEAMECNRILTFKNWMVLMCGSWGHSFHKFDKSEHDRDHSVVKKLHFQKILESQAVVVVTDIWGYTGSSTQAAIAFANTRHIPVFFFDGQTFYGETNRKPVDINADTSLVDKFAEQYGGLGF